MMKRHSLVFYLMLMMLTQLRADEIEARMVLDQWLSNSSKIKSVQAKFEQVRLLKSMTRPLRKEGMLWMEKPGRIRWQIGDPPVLLVQKDDANRMWVFDPKELKARVWNLKDMQDKELASGGQNFAMLDSMQSMSSDYIAERFKLKDGAIDTVNPALWSFDFTMKDTKAAMMVKQLTLKVNVKEGTLYSMILMMRDGSSMATNILSHLINTPIDSSVFKVNAKGYVIVEESGK